MTTTDNRAELDRLLSELIDANLDFEGFAQRHAKRVGSLIGELARALEIEELHYKPDAQEVVSQLAGELEWSLKRARALVE